jgi:hypothetical protein
MSAVLDFPVLDAPAATGGAVAKIDLKALALSRFGDWKPEAEKVVAKYKGVIFDATTPKGYKSLTEAIAEVRAPRYAAQNVSKASKSELAAVSKAVGAEEAAVAAFLDATEAELVAQKDAEDARRAEEAERARVAEAERVAGFNAKIAAIRECVTKARGLSAERIANGIAKVEAFTFSTEEWAEFAVPAADAQCQTLEAMRALHAAAVHDEAVEAQRVEQAAEQARVAEEQRVERERLETARQMIAKAEQEAAEKIAAERAQFERERAEFMAAQEAAKPKMDALQAGPVGDGSQKPDDGAAIPAAEAGSNIEALDSQQVLKAEAATPDATDRDAPVTASPSVGSMGAGQPADAGATEEPTLTLGDIKARIAPLSISADGLDHFGFAHAATKGAAKLYTETQFQAICLALVEHIAAVRNGAA